MIDIHTHVIFGVDDGPRNIEESIELLDELYKQGIRNIIATPHRRKGKFDTDWEIVLLNFEEIRKYIRSRYDDLNIYLGSEIYMRSRETVSLIESGEYISLAGKDYVLIEFPYNIGYTQIIRFINDILMLGKIPVIAHIERYDKLFEDLRRIEELREMGCIIQVNASSILNTKIFDRHKEYKKRAKKMLKDDLIDIISSDAHNMTSRAPVMQKAYNLIEKAYGEDRAKKLFFSNAYIVIKGEGVI